MIGQTGSLVRVYAKSVELAEVRASGTTLTTATPTAVIKSPSRRLSLMTSIAFETTSGATINSYAASTWSYRAMRRNRITGRVSELHTLVSNESLPSGYETDSAIREYRITTSLKIPLDAAAAPIPGRWVLLCEWEPNQTPPCGEEEIDRLFGDCGAELAGAVPILAP